VFVECEHECGVVYVVDVCRRCRGCKTFDSVVSSSSDCFYARGAPYCKLTDSVYAKAKVKDAEVGLCTS
jgi:hypothetical protein